MTDEAKALVERLRWSHWYYEDAGENTSYTSEAPLEAADLIEQLITENAYLREALKEARAALAGDSHDQ